MEAESVTAPCSECGASLPVSGECLTLLHELLAIETRVLPALEPEQGKRAHFFAVAGYQLQHPSQLAREAVEQLRAAVTEMAQQSARPIEQLRREVGRRTKGSLKVARSAPAGDRAHLDPRWPRRWSLTARDVLEAPEPEYPETVAGWARAILADLDAALGDGAGAPGAE